MHVRLSIPQLQAFLVLVEAKSFRDAATEMGVSQPAFSRTIQQIETRLGVRLFDRAPRHVGLTSAGEYLRLLAVKLLKEYEDSFQEFERYVAGHSGRVKVATLASVAALLLPAAVRRFQARHPKIVVDIWEAVGAPVHLAVKEGEAHFGIAPPPPETRGLNFRLIHNDQLVLVCRKDDILATHERHDWTVLRERPFIAMATDTGLRGLIDRALADAKVEVDPSFTCYPSTAGALVSASLGITVLTRLTMEQIRSPELTWRMLENPEASRPIGLVTCPARTITNLARDFMREVEDEARAFGLR